MKGANALAQDLAGAAALITGGAAGIGLATARLFLTHGARVSIVDISQPALDAAMSELSPLGEVVGIQADVASEIDVRRYVNETLAAFGTIDVFFNNAGIESPAKLLQDLSLEEFNRVIAVNLTGAFLGMKYVLPIMSAKRHGSIINTSSVVGLSGQALSTAYTASKHAIVGMTKVAALEVASSSVRVNSIHPTAVDTEMMRRLEREQGVGEGEYATGIPMGRYASPEDVANLVLFLASEKSRFITGSQLRVDGGEGAHS